jgi:hypothetical protein
LPDAKRVALLLVQPWLDAPGHPAQSLLHTARGLAGYGELGFLIPERAQATMPEVTRELARYGTVLCYSSRLRGLPNSTRAALAEVRRLLRSGWRFGTVWFFDAHLPVLSGAMAFGLAGSQQPYAVMLLQGPERSLRSRLRRALMLGALRRANCKFFCRTDELTASWQAALPEHRDRFASLPSIEISQVTYAEPRAPSMHLKLGILGQIRSGKGIERATAELHELDGVVLTIAGPYASKDARRRYGPLLERLGFQAGWLSEAAMRTTAEQQDYMLLLYDDWDERMESGILYLAASVGRPVVVYAGGWCARQVEAYGCGIVLQRSEPLQPDSWPRAGSEAYQRLTAGMREFAADHHGPRLAERLLTNLRTTVQ